MRLTSIFFATILSIFTPFCAAQAPVPPQPAIQYLFGVIADPLQNDFLTADIQTNLTTFQNTGLSLTIPAAFQASTNAVHGRCFLLWNNNGTVNAAQFGVGQSVSNTLYIGATITQTSTSAFTYTTINNTTTTQVAASTAAVASTNYGAAIDFTVINGGTAADTITIYYDASSSASNVFIKAGSYCSLMP